MADAVLLGFSLGAQFPENWPADRIPAKTILEDERKRGWDPAMGRVLTDWDPSWRAWVDGRNTPIARVGIFMRIAVRPCDRTIELIYDNQAYRRGRWVTGLRLVVFLLISFLSARRRGVE